MNTYWENIYGERIAGIYDDLYADHDPLAITALSHLARGGRALELGIGTGRIALPLQQAGIEVHGIDASESMVAKMRAKPGGESLPVTQQITSQHIMLTEQGIRRYPVKLRYVWPAELDLMARLAGLLLRHRWGDWQGSGFSAESDKHISIYEHAGQSQA